MFFSVALFYLLKNDASSFKLHSIRIQNSAALLNQYSEVKDILLTEFSDWNHTFVAIWDSLRFAFNNLRQHKTYKCPVVSNKYKRHLFTHEESIPQCTATKWNLSLLVPGGVTRKCLRVCKWPLSRPGSRINERLLLTFSIGEACHLRGQTLN